MESVPSYMGDSFPEDWIATLERLKAIDFDTTMPGHGVVFTGKAKIEAFQKYLRDAITQVTALKKQGLTAEAAAAKVDLTAHANEFATIRAAGLDVAAVRRIYQPPITRVATQLWHQRSDETVITTPNLLCTSPLAHGSDDGSAWHT
jgi:glyoxylase-like metal-dependent hydrolase (beta-lactamase superfamily II)